MNKKRDIISVELSKWSREELEFIEKYYKERDGEELTQSAYIRIAIHTLARILKGT